MVLCKLPVPGRPAGLDSGGARANCACDGVDGGCLDVFAPVFRFSSFSLSERRSNID